MWYFNLASYLFFCFCICDRWNVKREKKKSLLACKLHWWKRNASKNVNRWLTLHCGWRRHHVFETFSTGFRIMDRQIFEIDSADPEILYHHFISPHNPLTYPKLPPLLPTVHLPMCWAASCHASWSLAWLFQSDETSNAGLSAYVLIITRSDLLFTWPSRSVLLTDAHIWSKLADMPQDALTVHVPRVFFVVVFNWTRHSTVALYKNDHSWGQSAQKSFY